MSNFVYDCHREKIANGELKRLTGIIEIYANQKGAIALTNQNFRMFKYGDQRITPQQELFISKGDRKSFWQARKKVGDPIADVALPILNDSGVNGKVANWLTGLRSDPVKLNQLGIDLMIEHAKAVTRDLKKCIGNVPGVLSPVQVAEYHHIVFKKHKIGSDLLQSDGSWLFGGTLFNLPSNMYRMIWCSTCDFTGEWVGAK